MITAVIVFTIVVGCLGSYATGRHQGRQDIVDILVDMAKRDVSRI